MDLLPLIEAAVSAAQQGATAAEMRSHLVDSLEGKTTITVVVVGVLGNRVKLGFDAARMIPTNRGEIGDKIAEQERDNGAGSK